MTANESESQGTAEEQIESRIQVLNAFIETKKSEGHRFGALESVCKDEIFELHTLEKVLSIIQKQNMEMAKKILEELLAFARERQTFGIQTEVECRADPESHKRANRTGEAYGGGYEEASHHFKDEIERRLAELEGESK